MSQGDCDGQDDMLPILDDWLLPEEMEQIGDLGNGLDDAAGPTQTDRANVDCEGAAHVAGRLAEARRALDALGLTRWSAPGREGERIPEDVWRRLGDEALGLAAPMADLESETARGPSGAKESREPGLPAGIAASVRANLEGLIRAMPWVEADALRDALRSIHAFWVRETPSRMPR